jgi:MFS family permease
MISGSGAAGSGGRDRSQAGLDWLNFFVSNVQTGFGPFIASYLASEAWTRGQIGLALSIGTLTAMAVQVPAGAVVDAVANKRRLAFWSVVAIAVAALILFALPVRAPVILAEILHGVASCLLGPVIAAMSLAVAKRHGGHFGERLGRNARFASIGSGCAAGLMGAVGYWVSEGSVFLLAAVLVLPSLVALQLVRERGEGEPPAPRPTERFYVALLDRRLAVFAVCCAGFHLANAAMFPLAAVQVTRRVGSVGELVIAACLIVPQVLVALLSPMAGRAAERWGRRPVLLLGFLALPLRAVLFSVVTPPYLVVVVQALDGVSGAVFGVMLPLVVSDITRTNGRFNLSMGVVGLAIGGAASLSTWMAGVVADEMGDAYAFLVLAAVGIAASAVLWLFLPETRPPGEGAD